MRSGIQTYVFGLCLSLVVPNVGLGQDASWTADMSAQTDLATAALVDKGVDVVSFVCLRQSAVPNHVYRHDHWVMLINPLGFNKTFAPSEPANVLFVIDGEALGEAQMVMTMPEGQLASLIPLESPVVDRLKAGKVLQLSLADASVNYAVVLAGFSQSLQAVQAACQATAAEPQISETAPGEGAATAPAESVARGLAPGDTLYGSADCGPRVRQGEAELVIEGVYAGTITARLVVGDDTSLSEGTARIALVGEANSDGTYRFVLNPRARSMPGRVGQFKEFRFNAEDGVATFDGGDCKSLSLSPVLPDSPRMTIQVPAPFGGGLFQQAQSNRAKCEVLINWVSRLNVEYPEIDFYRTANNAGFSRKKITIFGDHDFIPVFGQAFDRMTYAERQAINNFAGQKCSGDPFVGSRMETYRAAADRPITGGSETQELTSDGYTATVLAVRRMREMRAAISAANVNVSAVDGVAQRENWDRMKAALLSEADTLWPSERKDMIEKLDLAIAETGSEEVSEKLKSVLSTSDPKQAVVAADQLLAALGSDANFRITPALRTDARSQLTAFRAKVVETILDAAIAKLEQKPGDISAALELRETTAQSVPELADLTPAERQRYEKALQQAIEARLSPLVADRLLALKGSTNTDLTFDANWIAEFDTEFAVFKDFASIAEARLQFSKHREARLQALLGDFQQEIDGQADEASKQAVFDKYLNWREDSSLSVFLEYQLLMP